MGSAVPFGQPAPQDVQGDATKRLIHPIERIVSAEEKMMYVKSHANYEPGEQRERGYSWVSKAGPIDPANYRFGAAVDGGEKLGVAKSMNPSLEDVYVAPPKIVSKRLEDHRELKADELGRARNLGYGERPLPVGEIFGKRSQQGPEWGVRECIGNYSPSERAPDEDLGRSVRPGFRNIAPEKRIFGVPSIRSDISAPAMKSVADHQNYGDEEGCKTLLYPPRFADGGVTQADFLQESSKEDLSDIFRAAGFDLSDEVISDTFERAKTLDLHGRVSVQSFRMALNGEA